MDPIHPIAPGPPVFPQAGPEPVRRLDPTAHERRRQEQQRRRRAQQQESPPEPGEDGEGPHVDVRA
jgi:hypothetical protein